MNFHSHRYIQSAEKLEAQARALRYQFTPGGNGDWTGFTDAKADYDSMINAAGLLRLFIKTLEQEKTMSITVDPHSRRPAHLDPVQYVPRVPSRREAEAAAAKIIAHLPQEIVDTLHSEIEIMRGFVWSR